MPLTSLWVDWAWPRKKISELEDVSIESSQEPKSKKNKAEGGEGEGKIFLNRETVTEGAAST